MKLKDNLRGFGIGIIFTTFVFMLTGANHKEVEITEKEIKAKAQEMGMLTAEEVEDKILKSKLNQLSEEATMEPSEDNKKAETEATGVSQIETANKTEEPEETQSIKQTEKPKATQAPKQTEKPKATQAPKQTEKPKATQAPKQTEKPKVTQAPKQTEKPKATQAPKQTKKPKATQVPKQTEKPRLTQTPKKIEEPKVTQKPKKTQAPKQTEAAEETQAPNKTTDSEKEEVQKQTQSKETKSDKKAEEQKEDEYATVTIKKGMVSAAIAEQFEKAGIVDDAIEFDRYLCENDYGSKIRTGTYRIKKGTTHQQIAKKIAGK